MFADIVVSSSSRLFGVAAVFAFSSDGTGFGGMVLRSPFNSVKYPVGDPSPLVMVRDE
jgi:hypothetical protein